MNRLSPDTILPADVVSPAYSPADHGVGIVHLGVGAFHRAHQAVYTDDALAAQGGDWRIAGVSLRSGTVATKMNEQGGRYSLLIGSDIESSLRVIDSIEQVIPVRDPSDGVVNLEQIKLMFDVLTRIEIRIVSLTVTEKAYGIDRFSGGINESDPQILQDLKNPEHPEGVIGVLVQALKLRREKNIPPFTILSCDNLPANGRLLRGGVIDFARHLDPELAIFIEQTVSFPCSMVDRITPAISDASQALVQQKLGAIDAAAVETEDFSQWVIEDRFPMGRPHWEAGGALFVTDVEPYEMMKLRMLNGTHSLIAYAGYLAGYAFVRDAMASTDLRRWVQAHLAASAETLGPVAGIDYAEYASSLEGRFANRSIAHATYQIAMDGTEKLPQRIFAPALHAVHNDQLIDTYAFASAAWMRYCQGIDEQGQRYSLQDPREAEIAKVLSTVTADAPLIYAAIASLPKLIPVELTAEARWQQTVVFYLDMMLQQGMKTALACCVKASD